MRKRIASFFLWLFAVLIGIIVFVGLSMAFCTFCEDGATMSRDRLDAIEMGWFWVSLVVSLPFALSITRFMRRMFAQTKALESLASAFSAVGSHKWGDTDKSDDG